MTLIAEIRTRGAEHFGKLLIVVKTVYIVNTTKSEAAFVRIENSSEPKMS